MPEATQEQRGKQRAEEKKEAKERSDEAKFLRKVEEALESGEKPKPRISKTVWAL